VVVAKVDVGLAARKTGSFTSVVAAGKCSMDSFSIGGYWHRDAVAFIQPAGDMILATQTSG
jgi:hypothetical protein